MDNDFLKKFYEFRKNNPIQKDSKDSAREDNEAFQKFHAEYERTKITNQFNEEETKSGQDESGI